jgi:putative Holliday junction resolvase
MNHSLGVSAQNAMTLAEQIKTSTGLPVELWDERLSSVSAAQMLAQAGFNSKKQKGMIDQSAAQIILQHYLDSKKNKPEK